MVMLDETTEVADVVLGVVELDLGDELDETGVVVVIG